MNSNQGRLNKLLNNLNPILDPLSYAFVSVEEVSKVKLEDALSYFKEEEGVTFVIYQEAAARYQLECSELWARITLQVHSNLNDVGLTAAVSGQLKKSNIPCNVIAAYHHDHIFVPVQYRDEALESLKELM